MEVSSAALNLLPTVSRAELQGGRLADQTGTDRLVGVASHSQPPHPLSPKMAALEYAGPA